MNIKQITIENLKAILAGFKTSLLSIVDKKIADNKTDISVLMDKESFVSKDDPSSVNKADISKKIEGIDSAPIFSVYGINQDGEKGFYSFPVSSASGGNFTKTLMDVKSNTKYSIDLVDERKYYDLICQVFKFIPGEQDKLQIAKTFDNTSSYNFLYDKENVSFANGMQINKMHSLETTTNTDGFFESEVVNKADYLIFSGIV